jgi:hypothetical protein
MISCSPMISCEGAILTSGSFLHAAEGCNLSFVSGSTGRFVRRGADAVLMAECARSLSRGRLFIEAMAAAIELLPERFHSGFGRGLPFSFVCHQSTP